MIIRFLRIYESTISYTQLITSTLKYNIYKENETKVKQ